MSGVEIAAIGAAAVGTGGQIYGQISGAQSAKELKEQELALKNIQAKELLERNAINERIIREKAFQDEMSYGSAAAETGFAGAGLGGVLSIKKQTEQVIANNRRDAEFKARMLRAGAEIELGLASDAITASYITGAGTLLTTGARVASAYSAPSSKTTSLPGGEK